MKKFNINDKVKVKLTDYGRDIYYHQYDWINGINIFSKTVIKPSYPKIDADGYTTFQLWHLMELYGQYLEMTGSVEQNTLPFETEILIDLPEIGGQICQEEMK
jgi:hypothetical protein